MQTKGQYRVGVSFNPSGDDVVTQIKAKAAELIDMIDKLHPDIMHTPHIDHRNEVLRLKVLAMTHIEDGAMWAVKAATKPAPEGF